MYAIRKLGPYRSYGMILIPFLALAGAALSGVFFGLPGAYTFLGAVFFIYAAYTFLTFARTGNPGFVVVAVFQITGGIVLSLRLMSGTAGRPLGLQVFLMAWMVLFLVWTLILTATKRIKWRGREILELAAASVEQAQNGYTGRPLPVGKTDFNQATILGFAAFARRNLLAAIYVGRDRVVLVPVREGQEPAYILGLKGNYIGETWVSFDFAGNVSANVSQRDYLDYREALSFDKLCKSLGDLFIEFVGMFQRGEGVRILSRLDALGLSMWE
jgi:hypothetical protein